MPLERLGCSAEQIELHRRVLCQGGWDLVSVFKGSRLWEEPGGGVGGITREEAGRPAQAMPRPRAAPIWASGPSFTLICFPASACGTEGLPLCSGPFTLRLSVEPFSF